MPIPATEQLPGDGMVVVGRVTGPHGIGGMLRIVSFTRPAENLLEYAPWSLLSDGAWREVTVCPDGARRHDNGFLCRVDGIDDREAAAALRGVLIGVPESALPETETDEYYWRDLIGLDVVTVGGEDLGRVENLMATGANDALVVSDGSSERLIPFIASVVRDVDLDRSVIVVDWEEPG
ncbi:MAG: ribosome maturation factor RimM [Gammaproteobacteria bacterium]|nr:ribosome maturation factor RimM [Gammaproteobacteria bacterium]